MSLPLIDDEVAEVSVCEYGEVFHVMQHRTVVMVCDNRVYASGYALALLEGRIAKRE